MASIGEEKRIRALFSELKAADEQTAPGFTALWHRAQSRSMTPRRAFNLSFVTATALLIFALASLAVWSRYSQPAAPAVAFGTVSAGSDFPVTEIKKATGVTAPIVAVKENRPYVKPRSRSAAQRHLLLIAVNKAANEAKEIASWKSPTASLLSSSSDDLFKSIPQLNENANELKSFLPNRENDKEK